MRWRTVLTPASERMLSSEPDEPDADEYDLPSFSSMVTEDQSTPL